MRCDIRLQFERLEILSIVVNVVHGPGYVESVFSVLECQNMLSCIRHCTNAKETKYNKKSLKFALTLIAMPLGCKQNR